MATGLFPPYWFTTSVLDSYVIAPKTGDINFYTDKQPITDTTSLVAIPTKERLKEYLKIISTKEGLSKEKEQQIENIIQCESNWDFKAKNEKGQSFGVMQFQKRTFNWFNKLKDDNLDFNSPYDQIELAVWAFNNGYESHWDCYHLLGYK